jgi:hypothetical protein
MDFGGPSRRRTAGSVTIPMGDCVTCTQRIRERPNLGFAPENLVFA